jgi:Fic family protein
MQNKFPILVFLFCLLFGSATAQEVQEKAHLAVTTWATKYQLDEAQQAKALKIAARKETQLAEIQSLLTTNPARYYAKLKAIQNGTLGSLKSVLTAPEQVKTYNQTLAQVRKDRSELRKKMQAEGRTKAEIEQAQIMIHAE